MSFEIQSTIPLLRMFDERPMLDFYIGFLGFQIDFEHRFEPHMPLYAQVSRAGMTFHLTGHAGDCGPHAKVFVWMTNLADLHAELVARAGQFVAPPMKKAFYGAMSVELTDPSGNRISFNERLSAAN